jgi:plastocyanin
LKRIAVPALAAGMLAMAVAGASASRPNGSGQHLSSKPGFIVAKGGGHNFRFSSTTIEQGKKLKVINNTGAPHTLSLVIPKLVPETLGQVKKCNSRGHICAKIAKWHKLEGQTIHRNPARAGKHGWDDEGSLHRTGDSVVMNPGTNPAFRKVTAPPGTVLHFICAIHPNMHGTIVVH